MFQLQFRSRVFTVFLISVFNQKLDCQFNFLQNFRLFLFHWLVVTRYRGDFSLLPFSLLLVDQLKLFVLAADLFSCQVCWLLFVFCVCYKWMWFLHLWGFILELIAFFQDTRNVAMNCIEGLHTLSSHVDSLSKKNGIALL